MRGVPAPLSRKSSRRTAARTHRRGSLTSRRRSTAPARRYARRSMPPPSTPCPHCGRAFFPSSLQIHIPQCQAKMARMIVLCPACGVEVAQLHLSEHMSRECKVIKRQTMAMQGRAPSPKGSRRGPQTERGPRRSSGASATSSSTGPKTERSQPPPHSFAVAAPDPDGRVACARCGRKFAPDRIAQHQFICVQLKRGPARQPSEVAQEAKQRVQTMVSVSRAASSRLNGRGRGRGGASAVAGGAGRTPPRGAPKSSWREQSYALQEAIRNARMVQKPHGGSRSGVGTAAGRGGCVSHRAYETVASSASGRPPVRRPPSSPSSSRPASRPTLAQRKHAAESQRLQEALAASPPRSHRSYGGARVNACNGSIIGSSCGGAFTGGGGPFGGGGGMPGGFDPTSNRTSPNNPLYRGY